MFATLPAHTLGTYAGVLAVHPRTFDFIANDAVYQALLVALTDPGHDASA
ncbi:MAG: hypothetical protein ACRDK0_05245 [Solirubrobacteraceae bacterium]